MNKLLIELMAMLEALRLLHHTLHLNACGCAGYARHLLFERLYGGIVDDFDKIGEHAVRLGAKVCPCDIAKQAMKWQETWEGEENDIAHGLTGETALVRAISVICKKVGDADLGVDNTLRAMAESHGTAMYLLGQAMKECCCCNSKDILDEDDEENE